MPAHSPSVRVPHDDSSRPCPCEFADRGLCLCPGCVERRERYPVDVAIRVRTESPIGTISPRLYGHFAEHLGRCCYEGLWVGSQSRGIESVEGFRRDVLDALRELPVPLLRWPGGCYADHYHWRDGIGPVDERPRRLGMSCDLQVLDDNSLGTHEFLRLCELLGAEPYLAGNVGTGSPQELCDWVEYCNTPLDTTLARLRRKHGTPDPFGVRLWGVGNENWGCGGNFDAGSYAREYRRYATMLRHVDPGIELVASGHNEVWNCEVLETLRDHLHLVDHLSIHSYWIRGGPETDFSEEDYYRLLSEAEETEAFVGRTAALIEEAARGRHRIGIALDEWGVWHPEARTWGPGEVQRRSPITLEQANTLRDALAAAVALEGFHRQCQVLALTNLAQVVNVLHAPVMTEGSRMWLTPTYHVLHLHRPHIGATAVEVSFEEGVALPDGLPAVSATASTRTGSLAVTLINRHICRGLSVRVSGVPAGITPKGRVLTAAQPDATNSAEEPEAVKPTEISVERDGPDGWRVEMPPHSLVTVTTQQ